MVTDLKDDSRSKSMSNAEEEQRRREGVELLSRLSGRSSLKSDGDKEDGKRRRKEERQDQSDKPSKHDQQKNEQRDRKRKRSYKKRSKGKKRKNQLPSPEPSSTSNRSSAAVEDTVQCYGLLQGVQAIVLHLYFTSVGKRNGYN
jgi:hypothetical protein